MLLQPDRHPGVMKPAHLLSPCVLVVEDETRLRELLTDVIPEMGFCVTAVRSAEEAIKSMAVAAPQILLLDLQLPVMGGMDLFEHVHQRWPVTPVIIMTGFGDLESARRSIQLDVVDFITKPFHLRDIEQALDRARKRILQEIKLPETGREDYQPRTLAQGQRQMILQALERNAGNRTAAATELGISRRKLHYWLTRNSER